MDFYTMFYVEEKEEGCLFQIEGRILPLTKGQTVVYHPGPGHGMGDQMFQVSETPVLLVETPTADLERPSVVKLEVLLRPVVS